MTGATCISLSAWVLPVLGACLFAGMFVGFSLRFWIDRAELTCYRRLARRDPLGFDGMVSCGPDGIVYRFENGVWVKV